VYMRVSLSGHFSTSPPPHRLLVLILPSLWDFPEWLHQCKRSVHFSRQAFQVKLLTWVDLCSWVSL
jgi:hypothetical protein